ncbi:Vanillin dehydrogenase [Cladobotryum mycophilum]|uniref:Vanillin dehydrogenase n=1 Tax=Cladobotryum mycophilum TaxID=491253 RepID=A0ABR0SKH8_9HYPO
MSGTENVVPLLINGADYYPEKTFDVVSPVTGKVIHQCGSASVADAGAAVDAAADAFRAWRKTKPKERRDIFFKAAEILEKRHDEIVKIASAETGGTPFWCSRGLTRSAEYIRDIGARISAVVGTFPAVEDSKSSAITLREPYGVILSIVPWNAPFTLGIRAIASPVAVGNTVVLKATELAPLTVRHLVTAFEEAGLPKGVMNFIAHEPAAAAAITSALITNTHIRKINFTGSTNVGRIIGRLAGENLKPVVLELGGKAPAIVWEDADLDLAADSCARGAFTNSGQICMSTERILVHKAVKTEFAEKLKVAINKIFPSEGDAMILINEAGVKRNKALVADATAKGAEVLHGDVNTEEISHTRLRPIVVDKVTSDMDIYNTESFGPTVSLYEIETEEEALRIANDTEYGLTSAVFTEDLRRGLRFAREIEAGAVHINSPTTHDEPALPHGGFKSSGFGKFNSAAGLEEWVWLKNITFKN